MYSSSTGSIQAALKKLLNNGFIDYNDIQENDKKKKEYFITEAGRKEFNKWINSPVESSGIKCPELTKIYFMGFTEEDIRPEIIHKYIEELRNKYKAIKLICDESVEFFRSDAYRNLEKQAKDIIFYQFTAARFGRDLMSFTINWYENLSDEIRSYDE